MELLKNTQSLTGFFCVVRVLHKFKSKFVSFFDSSIFLEMIENWLSYNSFIKMSAFATSI